MLSWRKESRIFQNFHEDHKHILPSISKKTFQSILLIFLGIFLCFLCLEIGLRTAGFVFFQIQEAQNQHSFNHGQDFTILCIGESTTALGGEDSFPHQLEEFLNTRQHKIHFSVINKGIPAATTTQLTMQLKENLERFEPRMVITMLGINDRPDTLAYQGAVTKNLNFLSQLKIVKLFKLLVEHLKYKKGEFALANEKKQQLKMAEKRAKQNPSMANFLNLEHLYADSQQPELRKGIILKAIELESRNPSLYIRLARYYADRKDYSQMELNIKQALSLVSKFSVEKLSLLNYLAECYMLQKKYTDAEDILHHIIEATPHDPNHFGVYTQLIDMALQQDKTEEAYKLYFQQLTFDPKKPGSFAQMAHYYRKQNKTTF